VAWQQMQKKPVEKPYTSAFAAIQGMRMMGGGFCSQAKVDYFEIR
jgi:hypothetical protein